LERDLAKELDSRSREFYEFIMLAIDIIGEGNDLIVTVVLPSIVRRISTSELSVMFCITAKREQAEALGTVYHWPRPLKINKRVLLPISSKVEEEEKVEGKATYENGIATPRMPVPRSTNIPIT
jgi:hypothetical protein